MLVIDSPFILQAVTALGFLYLLFIFILDVDENGRAGCRGLSLVHAKESQPLVTISVLVGLQDRASLTFLVLRKVNYHIIQVRCVCVCVNILFLIICYNFATDLLKKVLHQAMLTLYFCMGSMSSSMMPISVRSQRVFCTSCSCIKLMHIDTRAIPVPMESRVELL